MRHMLAGLFFTALALCASAPASAANIHYLSCRADNESQSSVFGIDETTQKVCDRDVGPHWFTPFEFDAGLIEWSDGTSTKAIYRAGKNKHYEHNIFILNHVGRCNKVPTPQSPPCTG